MQLLRNGEELIIRPAQVKDAQRLLDYCNTVGGESDNLTYGKNQFVFNFEQEKIQIAAMKNAKNSILIIGEIKDQIVSGANISGHMNPRFMHKADLGVTVLKAYWHQGIGTAMIGYLINWAHESAVLKKLNLEVKADNFNAIKLYEKCGFHVEGRISHAFWINNTFYDSLIMGRMV
jgi:RimJ/RimL family protein N-acetyltransferase